MDTRLVIGHFLPDSYPLNSKAICFPDILAWIDEKGTKTGSSPEQDFPPRGTVFLAFDICDGAAPYAGQYGFLTCIPSGKEDRSWRVKNLEKSLCEVIKAPDTIDSFLRLYDWLRSPQVESLADIFGGSGMVYVELPFCELLIGPFSVTASILVPCNRGIFCWKTSDIIILPLLKSGHSFVDTARLQMSHPFPADVASLVKKVCGLLNGKLESERKLKAFAEALAEVHSTQYIAQAIPEITKMLETVGAELAHEPQLVADILSNKQLSDALEIKWLEDHRNRQKESTDLKAELVSLNAKKTRLDKDYKTLEAEWNQRTKNVGRLIEEESRAKQQAQTAFSSELAALAAEPVKLAVFKSIFSQSPATPAGPMAVKVAKLEDVTSRSWANIETDLGQVGISGFTRSDLSIVCKAAFSCGQPIWVRSIFSEIIAKSLLACRGHQHILNVDVPAGLLEPLVLTDDDMQLKAVLFHHANRSDLSLVWAGIRERLLNQIIKPTDVRLDVVLTLEPNPFLSVKQNMPFGPVLDDEYLGYRLPKDFQKESKSDNPPLISSSESDFEEILGPSLSTLEPLATSSFRMTCRLASNYLKTAVDNDVSQARRLLFKYWLLPRISISDAQKVFQENAKEWASDPMAKKLGERAPSDDNV